MILDAEAPETLAVWEVQETWAGPGLREILGAVAEGRTSCLKDADWIFSHRQIQVEQKFQCQMDLQDLLVILVPQLFRCRKDRCLLVVWHSQRPLMPRDPLPSSHIKDVNTIKVNHKN